jgi:MoaA/NifB/PqqE/SkfB family radical SAM enzyme
MLSQQPKEQPSKIPTRIDLIWNHTRICGWDCKDCCVAAHYVQGEKGSAKIYSSDLRDADRVQRLANEHKFATAQRIIQARGEELKYEEKVRVLDHLAGFNVKLDLSGGDALVTPDGLPLLEAASSRLGRSNLTLTVTGAGVRRESIGRVAELIGELNFTFNSASPADVVTRPRNYAASNLKLAQAVKRHGVITRAECPLTKTGTRPDHLRRLYDELAKAGIDKLLLMRQFPVGRGALLSEHVPSRSEYVRAIATIRELEAEHKGPSVHLQCALRHIEFAEGLAPLSSGNPCDLGHASYGLMTDGTLLASAWALNEHGRPLHPSWVLGNLSKSSLMEIIMTEKCQTILRRADENYGECKIFSFLHSRNTDTADRLFDRADPLYAPTERPPAQAGEEY